jgi:alpha-D-ribose 1-methylphosphonate 5-triphosphate diphosphatase
MDAMAENLVDILCSDYHFPAMLSGMLKMLQNGKSPSQALALVSLNPARCLGVDDKLGSIKIGKKADLVAFDMRNNHAVVRYVWVNGRRRFSCC